MFGIEHEVEYQEFVKLNSDSIFAELNETLHKLKQENYIFKNIDFPLYPKFLLINYEVREMIRGQIEFMMSILEKVIYLYKIDLNTRKYFMLTPEQELLTAIDPGYSPCIRISRFDTFLTGDATPFKILENNTDCPAGVVFTGRVMRIIKNMGSLKSLFARFPDINEDNIEQHDSFFNEIFKAYADFCVSSGREPKQKPNIVILQIRNKANIESVEMIKILSALGFTAMLADPRDLKYVDGVLLFNETPLDLVWNKINTAFFNEMLGNMDDIKALVSACSEKAVCHINSFQARYITESKLCMSYLCESQFAHHFNLEEQDLISRLLPWACKLTEGMVQFNSEYMDIKKLAYKYQEILVLKAAYDIRGDGVTIGRGVSKQDWQELISVSMNKPFILQKFIEPPQLAIPVAHQQDFINKKFSLDMFMFGGKLQGFGSKVSLSDKLNLFQGGSKMPVFTEKAVDKCYSQID